MTDTNETRIIEIIEDIKEIKTILYKIREDDVLLKKDIYGNGKKGLITKMEELEEKIYKNDRYIYFAIAIFSFISFIPVLKIFINILK